MTGVQTCALPISEQKDFGVRTFGMPDNPGFLGVCFGCLITANSPASARGHASNWEATLWHEFCHVVTLTLTRNKMPRWLSEGISVHEERQASPAWGQVMNPRYREMILGGELTPVGDLSSAFLTAKSDVQLQFAYYQSSLVVQFLVEKFGAEKLRKILADLATGKEVNQAIAAHTAADPDRMLLALRGSGQALYVGLADDAFVVASEPYGVVEETDTYLRLDGETPGNPENPGASRGQVVVLDASRAGTADGIARLAYDGTALPLHADDLQRAQITTRDKIGRAHV